MPCEHYKDALIEAAANDGAPSAELREHLAACATCSAAFAEKQSLFAAIDSGLHAAANAEVPTSLLPRVRARLDEAAARRFRWMQPLVFASAGVALTIALFLMSKTRHAAPQEVAEQGAVVVPAPTTHTAKANSENVPSDGSRTAAIRVSLSHASRNSTTQHSAASSRPDVLVPPEEREAFARFLSRDRALAEQASVTAARAPRPPQESVEILPVEIADLTIMPLNQDEGRDEQSGF